jgi:hypothetical protein
MKTALAQRSMKMLAKVANTTSETLRTSTVVCDTTRGSAGGFDAALSPSTPAKRSSGPALSSDGASTFVR